MFQEQKSKESPRVSQSSSLDEKIDTVSTSVGVRRVLEVLYGNHNKIIKLSIAGRSVVFDIEHRRYYTTNLVQMEIEDLLVSPVENIQLEDVNHNQLAKAIQNLKAQDLDVPLWTAA